MKESFRRLFDRLTRPIFLYKEPTNRVPLTPRTIAVRAAVAIVSALWFAFFPIYLCIIYMHQEFFFSYDFFIEGLFGLKTFLFVGFVVLVVASFCLWGFLYQFRLAQIRRARTGSLGGDRWWTYFCLLIALLLHPTFLYLGISTGTSVRYALVAVSGLVLAMICCAAAGRRFIDTALDWRASFFLVVVTVTIPIFYREAVADFVGLTLANFNMGGGVHAKVLRNESGSNVIHEGKLLLLTSRYAYFREGKRGFRMFLLSEGMSVAAGTP